MTATFEKPRQTMFVSRRAELRLVKKPIETVRNMNGTIVSKTKGETLEFKNGRFDADSQEIVEYLREHQLFGDRQDGFWEIDQPVPEPTQDELAEIIDAATAFDVPELERIQKAEQAGWQRQKVLEILEGTLVRVKAALAQEAEGK